jgi:hypothetical protein
MKRIPVRSSARWVTLQYHNRNFIRNPGTLCLHGHHDRDWKNDFGRNWNGLGITMMHPQGHEKPEKQKHTNHDKHTAQKRLYTNDKHTAHKAVF